MTGSAQELALTLFRLAPGRSVEEYRAFSLQIVRDGMLRMPAVEGFLDLEVTGSLTGADGWDLVEIIQISSRADFIRDNDTIGAGLAAEWEEWVADFRVLFLTDLDRSVTRAGRLVIAR
ncbi:MULTISPECIES: hypothetical protein [unclassified Curtobacterium]|uniref:hypothetical protein n=1 Tax=unclassified Curtobacterium TaxID=257496 RepID=UPI000DA94FB3|nr:MULTISPECIES: hypothetical protein [unclassified Curtobacterium]PZE26062.1 hypothetical protein DEI86_09535 [Curtobacterium sp. MCBD17_028]PZE77734.1 hypothetical protein DEI82_02695 [Curtobacterium sp. MCBD17_019]PZF62057.1 hypothetical protein DEI92_00580 [Curtobacterium sp. MCBD17_034]PZM34010.1 hypothetical protein DEI90_10120 [Curtobacterium sp. MCBD17_031]WIE54700.1 hypothetical protein DEI88_000405 [Curtobacterium sp. MCBD17_003]